MTNPPTPPHPVPSVGIRIAGAGSCVPERRLTNADLEKSLDTSDEWIIQRTGIRERRICDPAKNESNRTLSAEALRKAIANARMQPDDLDMIIVGTCTGESTVPSVACRVADILGIRGAGAFDITAACCGFVYSLNVAQSLIASGACNTVGVVGCDIMSSIIDYKDRSVCILFGDAAGAVVIRRTDDPTKGLLTNAIHADGAGWQDLHLPRRIEDVPEEELTAINAGTRQISTLHMNGRAVYKFAVTKFCNLIQETLDKAGLTADDVDHFVCHQSNARILESAREKFGIPKEKLLVNIDAFGNCSGGSVPLCFDQLWSAGKIKEGQIVLFVAFGAGLTWASSLWRV